MIRPKIVLGTGYGVGTQNPVYTVYTQVLSKTVGGTGSETTLIGTTNGIGTYVLPANLFKVGTSVRITARGYHSATGGPTITFKVKLGSTTVGSTGALNSHNATNEEWQFHVLMTCRSVGSSGTVFVNGDYNEYHASGASGGFNNTSTSTIDTTATQAIDVTVQWGTSSASNTITCSTLIIEVIDQI